MKNILLDFGKVLGAPATGHWFITPKFLKKVNIKKVDVEKLKQAINLNYYLISQKIETLEEEFKIFYEFYSNILTYIDYNISDCDLEEIVNNFVYDIDKYIIYENVKEELEKIRIKYEKVILFTDNWPCINKILKVNKINNYFDKIYISSVYGINKKDLEFFEIVINENGLVPSETLFIDDNEQNLDNAIKKGVCVKLMDREGKISFSKHEIIRSLSEII